MLTHSIYGERPSSFRMFCKSEINKIIDQNEYVYYVTQEPMEILRQKAKNGTNKYFYSQLFCIQSGLVNKIGKPARKIVSDCHFQTLKAVKMTPKLRSAEKTLFFVTFCCDFHGKDAP